MLTTAFTQSSASLQATSSKISSPSLWCQLTLLLRMGKFWSKACMSIFEKKSCLLISYWTSFQGSRYWCESCHIFIFEYQRAIKCKSQWRIRPKKSNNYYTDIECYSTPECRRKEEKVSLWILTSELWHHWGWRST